MPKVDGVKVELVGKLLRRKDGTLGPGGGYHEYQQVIDIRDAKNWLAGHPGPEPPKDKYGETNWPAQQKWQEAYKNWVQLVYASEEYSRRCTEFIEAQKTEPQWFEAYTCAYQGRIYHVDGYSVRGLTREELTLLVQHFVLTQQRMFKSISREIKAFENLERMTHREVIPESVRIFVWQRDGGKCVECGRRDGLEFDHIIPVSEGGASTERNVQLLCLRCNRNKGKNV